MVAKMSLTLVQTAMQDLEVIAECRVFVDMSQLKYVPVLHTEQEMSFTEG